MREDQRLRVHLAASDDGRQGDRRARGQSRLIGTITLKNGVKQVTYAGHPLYTYVANSAPGQTFYVNVSQFGGRWPAVNAAGNEVK